MKQPLQNLRDLVLIITLFSFGGCSVPHKLAQRKTLKPNKKSVLQKVAQRTWRDNVRKLRHHRPLDSIATTPSLQPFKVDLSCIYKPISSENLSCIDFQPPYLQGFPLIKIQDDYENLRDDIVHFAKNYLGLPYHWSGTSPETGFDCSGFTHYIMQNFGVNISRSSRDQATMGKEIELSDARKGDFLFFGRKSKCGVWRVSHVAMVVSEEDEDLAMIHSCNRGIVIDDIHSSSWRSHYKRRFMGIRRILQPSDYEQILTMQENQGGNVRRKS